MTPDRFTAVLDANVIAGSLTRNMLLSLAEAELFRPRWSEQILDEFQRFFKKQYHDANTAERHRIAMETAFPEASVADYTPLISLIELPDVNDRQVVACAIKTKASVIVTENLKDFPIHVLAPYDLFAIGIDDFIADTIDLAPIDAVTAIRLMRARFRNPTLTPHELMVRIEKIGLTQTASLLERYADFL